MAKKITTIALLCALTVALAYIERLLPSFVLLPHFKLGLSNIVLLFALYTLPWQQSLIILFAKIGLFALLFGSFSALLYAFFGGILALAIMLLLSRSKKFSPIGVSVAGAVCHNIGQVIAACLLLGSLYPASLLPLLLLGGIVTGLLTGLVGSLLIAQSRHFLR